MSCACGQDTGACHSRSSDPRPASSPAEAEAEAHATFADGCSGGEPIALQVLGGTMLPEFRHGDVVVIEPDGALDAGCYVLARVTDDWQLRLLERDGAGAWALRRLNPAAGEAALHPIADLSPIWGVVIQRSVPGRRRERKSYLRPRPDQPMAHRPMATSASPAAVTPEHAPVPR
ncbi:MAG: hypothetical protein RL722_2167 [Pseudomonadota bacterium]|jgi:hypothetical protein